MGKILYIEDQLTKNTEKIIRLFSSLFPDEEITRELQESIHRPEDIVQACQRVSCLDICYQFPTALEKIINHHADYDLFIIDRNLSEQHYHNEKPEILKLLNSLKLDNPEKLIDDHNGKEGDLLFWILLIKKYSDNIFIFTANHAEHLAFTEELGKIMTIAGFDRNRIIIKSTDNEEYLIKAISDSVSFQIGNEYHEQCSILRKRMCEHEVNQYINIIIYARKGIKAEFLSELRNLLIKILESVAFKINERGAKYWNPANKNQLTTKSFIKGFWNENVFYGLPAYNEKNNIGYNSIIRNACLSLFEIASDFGEHRKSKSMNDSNTNIEEISCFTIQALIAQICDVILWYDKVMEIITK